MELKSRLGRLKNLLMSKFGLGYHRLPKSESRQPLLSQDSYYENNKYEYQSIEDEGNASSKKAISSLEEKIGFLDDQIRRMNSDLYKIETDFHTTSVNQKAIQKLQQKNASLDMKLENAIQLLQSTISKNHEVIQKLQQSNSIIEKNLKDVIISIQSLGIESTIPPVSDVTSRGMIKKDQFREKWWRTSIKPEHKLFVLGIINKEIPTSDELKRRRGFNIPYSSVCKLCKKERESIDHIFRDCQISQRVWSGSNLGINATHGKNTEVGTWVKNFLHYLLINDKGSDDRVTEFTSILCSIWLARNKAVFEQEAVNPITILYKARCLRVRIR